MKFYEVTAWDKYNSKTHMFIQQPGDETDRTVCVETKNGNLYPVPLCVFHVVKVYLNVPLSDMIADVSQQSVYIYNKHAKKRYGRICYKLQVKEF